MPDDRWRPAGAKVISTAVGDGRIVVTIEIAGATELGIFDLHTLKPLGRVRLNPSPWKYPAVFRGASIRFPALPT